MQFGFNFSDKNSCTNCCCCCERFELRDLLNRQFLSQDGETGGSFRPFVIEWTPPRSVDSEGKPIRESEPCDGEGAGDSPPPRNEFVVCNDTDGSNPCCPFSRRQPTRGTCTENGVCTDGAYARDCQGFGQQFEANVDCEGNPVEFEPVSREWACPAGEWTSVTACLRFLCRCVRSDGSVVCSKEYGGPTVNELDLTELFIGHFGPEPEPGCYIYEAQFFGWRRPGADYGNSAGPDAGWIPSGVPDPSCDNIASPDQVNEQCTFVSRDNAYCLFRGKIGENCGQYPRGACCDEFDTCLCSRTYEADCPGVWYENTTCEDQPCGEQPLGACCYEDGSCAIKKSCDCDGSSNPPGESWLEGFVCEPNPCEPLI